MSQASVCPIHPPNRAFVPTTISRWSWSSIDRPNTPKLSPLFSPFSSPPSPPHPLPVHSHLPIHPPTPHYSIPHPPTPKLLLLEPRSSSLAHFQSPLTSAIVPLLPHQLYHTPTNTPLPSPPLPSHPPTQIWLSHLPSHSHLAN